MKTTRVAINGGAVATPITANIPAKSVRIVEDNAVATEVLLVQLLQSDNSFSVEVQSSPGDTISLDRLQGILARPAGYSASNVPATGETYCKIRTQSGNNVTVKVTEYEEYLARN